MKKNKEITILINKKLPEFTDSELVTEIIKRIDSNTIEISALAKICMTVGKIAVEKPDLYLKVMAEMKK